MNLPPPLLDARSEDHVVAELSAEAGGFAPGWIPTSRGAGAAVVRAFARFIRALAERVNAAPDKNRLAFFEQLGIETTPAQAAIAPVVFEPLRGVGDSRVPAHTRLGANDPDNDSPLVFETESTIALAAAPLAEVVTLWPGRDAFADHTDAFMRGEPFTLFSPLRPVPHEFYLAHDTVLALAGPSTVEVDVRLASGAAAPLQHTWEYWDGRDWRAFRPFEPVSSATEDDSVDGTAGFARSGVVRLVTDCAAAKRTRVDGIDGYWIRARLTEPLPPDERRLPQIARLGLRTTIDRRLPAVACGLIGENAGLLPDDGYGGATRLDFSRAVQPLGAHPQAGDAFYLASEEIFAKAGAEVTLCFTKVDTAHEVIDQLGAEYEEDANNAQRVTLQAAIHAARALHAAGHGVLSIIRRDSLPTLPDLLPPAFEDLENAANDLATAIGIAEGELANAIANDLGIDLEAVLDPMVEPARAVAYWLHEVNTQATASQPAASPPTEPLPEPPIPEPPGSTPPARHTGLENPQPFDDPPIIGPGPHPGWPWPWGHTHFVDASVTDLEDAANASAIDFFARLAVFIANNETRVRHSGTASRNAASAANAGLEQLDTLTPIDAVRAAGVVPPPMPDPVVTWEYWNGSRWRSLVVQGPGGARAMRGDGPVTFFVPDDIESTAVNGTEARWIRARLRAGGYGTVRLVSWRDEKTQRLNFFPIVQVRPPSIEGVRLGYHYRSASLLPDHCVAFNDFRYRDHTRTLRERRNAVPPFEPVEDRTPALYLGFDGRLPVDRIGLFADIEEVLGEESGPRIEWEGWTGQAWERVAVEDGTGALALPGTLAVLWPGTAEPPAVPVIEARGDRVRTEDARQAALFAAGDRVEIRQGGSAELARVAGADDDVVLLATPLERDYQGATMEVAGLTRFGKPRTWIRARLSSDGRPRSTRVNGLYSNAVRAAHAETHENQRAGSGTGQPDQVLFSRLVPILEEELEVRELEGARASVEEATLREELKAAGLPDIDIRTETDTRTGRVVAVWVRWKRRPNLLLSRPGAREYSIEHSRGRVVFGDDENRARILPAGHDNVRFSSLRTGGGRRGNVGRDRVSQVLAGVLAGGVTNVKPAEGGADVESLDRLRDRAPAVLRHRSQAITAADYESLALQSSPAVAVARALPNAHPTGRRAPGWVTVQIVPHSAEPRPVASFEVRQRVRRHIAARAPAAIAHRIAVLPALYLPVGVTAVIRPVTVDEAGRLRDEVLDALRSFLHPLAGGPDGKGWPFGRDVYVSDVASMLERMPGMDVVESLALERDGSPAGDRVIVPADRIVVAGPLCVTLAGGGR